MRIAAGAAEELVDRPSAARRRRSRTRPSRRRPGGRGRAGSARRAARAAVGPDSDASSPHVGAEDRLVVLGEDLRERGPMGLVVGTERPHRRRSSALIADGLHRDDRRREPALQGIEDPPVVGAGAVDLVDEDQRRDAEVVGAPGRGAGSGAGHLRQPRRRGPRRRARARTRSTSAMKSGGRACRPG